MDQNTEVVAQQAASIGKIRQELEKKEQQLVYLGWNSDYVNVPVDALWKVVNMKARSPEKFMDVSDLNVSDEDGSLSRSMAINANNTIVKERIWIKQDCVSAFYPDTGAPLRDERVITVREEPNLHLEFYQQNGTDGMR